MFNMTMTSIVSYSIQKISSLLLYSIEIFAKCLNFHSNSLCLVEWMNHLIQSKIIEVLVNTIPWVDFYCAISNS